ncbi:MAG TPA: 2,3-bisphosphoglycerate-independent phosphoglycerate mutase [Candidatus Limnocylindria bacterium]|nr:2,3-bisphosphoglycerate-independent phosphoglycerate mutase [Candidatus Limnocylindria bacterium]
MTPGTRPRPIVLIVIDGFGIGRDPAGDAILAARTPTWDALRERWPHARLEASAEAVGLPDGQMGNSEVGHLNIGAGRPVLQDLPRIDAAIADGSFFERPALVAACARATERGSGALHVVSLIGPGGVHANDRHLVVLAELAARRGVPSVRVHALLDGRDTPPSSALGFVADLEPRLRAAHPDARIATVGGRYFAMDRDQRWERIELGYDAILHGEGMHAASASAAIEAAYARGETDEFVMPTVIDGVDGRVCDGDAIVHASFRADRARQLTHALADVAFDAFDRSSPSGRPAPSSLLVVTMTAYEADLPVAVAFPPEVVPCLAGAFERAGWRQLHAAETEKYAHVTYFLNGGREAPFEGEDRVLVPSPKAATYDLQPEMSAAGVTDALIAGIASAEYDVVIGNLANPDMVGHTGVWDATVMAVEAVDAALARIVAALTPLEAGGGLLVITADHGNADALRTTDGDPITAHSLNPVPILIAGETVDGRHLADGVLADVAPTILELAGLPGWAGITGRSLLRG